MRKGILCFIMLLCLLLSLPAQAEQTQPTVLGVAVPAEGGTLDLTGLAKVQENQAATLIAELTACPEVTEVNLRGVSMSNKTRAQLVEALPQVRFLWSVQFGNKVTVDTDTNVIDLDTPYGQLKLSEIAAALKCLPGEHTVLMNKYRPNPDTMYSMLIKEFPNVDFHWTMHWFICDGRAVDLKSDATAFSTLKGRQEPRYTAKMLMEKLQYFPDLLAIDVGHNNVSDLSFLLNWPKLKRLICIDSKVPVTDISPLAQLPDLEYIELFMQDITDLTPLANHTKLLDLNLCHNDVSDLTPLYSCVNLERLYISYNPRLTQAEIDAFKAALPNCHVETETWGSTDAGWREHPRYQVIKKSFEDNVCYPFED